MKTVGAPTGRDKEAALDHLENFNYNIFVHRKKEPKSLPPNTFRGLKIYYLNAFAVETPPQTPLGELTALSQAP